MRFCSFILKLKSYTYTTVEGSFLGFMIKKESIGVSFENKVVHMNNTSGNLGKLSCHSEVKMRQVVKYKWFVGKIKWL